MVEIVFNRRDAIKVTGAGALASQLPKSSAAAEVPFETNQAMTRGYIAHFVQTPTRRFVPKDETQAQKALATLRDTGSDFAIQSSGHCFSGFSQHKDALIDMRAMRGISIDRTNNLVRFAAGTTIGDLNRAMSAAKKATPVGTCHTVAMSGLVTLGGYGIMTRLHGVACDSLVAARIITANGQIRQIDGDSDPDLFWALKGGGAGSFGLLTELTMRTYDAAKPQSVIFRIAGDPKTMVDWLSGATEIIQETKDRADFYFRKEPISTSGRIQNYEFQVTHINNPDLLNTLTQKFARLGSLRSAPEVYADNLRQMTDPLYPKGYPVVPFQIGHRYLKAVPKSAEWVALFERVIEHQNRQAGLNIRFLGGAVDDLPRDAAAYPHRGNFATVQAYALWRKDEALEPARKIINTLLGTLRRTIAPGQYANYTDRTLVDYADAYWAENYPRLQQVKAAYDPEDVFHYPHSVRLPA